MDAAAEPLDGIVARPTRTASFKFSNLPPGDYYAIAVEYVAQGEWQRSGMAGPRGEEGDAVHARRRARQRRST